MLPYVLIQTVAILQLFCSLAAIISLGISGVYAPAELSPPAINLNATRPEKPERTEVSQSFAPLSRDSGQIIAAFAFPVPTLDLESLERRLF